MKKFDRLKILNNELIRLETTHVESNFIINPGLAWENNGRKPLTQNMFLERRKEVAQTTDEEAPG